MVGSFKKKGELEKMARLTQYTCDTPGCAQVRTPSNHWFIVKCKIATDASEESSLSVMSFDEDEYDDWNGSLVDTKCFCGETHALQYIASQLALFYPPKLPTIKLKTSICTHELTGITDEGVTYCKACGTISSLNAPFDPA